MVRAARVFHVMAVDIQTRDGGVYGRITVRTAPERLMPTIAHAASCCCVHLRRALNLHLSVSQTVRSIACTGCAMAHLMVGAIVLDESGHVLER